MSAIRKVCKLSKRMIMTREEEIITEAKKHYYDDINCHNAFLHGVEWADQHPNLSSLRHDASEEPWCDKLLLGEDTDGFSIYRWCGQEDNWEAFVNENGLSLWAYIDDLLPKQFGISEQLKGGEK